MDIFAIDDPVVESCFDYERLCHPPFSGPCQGVAAHQHVDGNRYSDASASWVLTSAIIVFFMKAGFLLIELAFAQNIRDKRHVVVVKHLDVFASAFGFFFLGFDIISNYSSPPQVGKKVLISDPILWFFRFTFASNTATILGGCLVTNKYKLRVPAAFLSSFVISGIVHPLIARFIWGDDKQSAYFSPYRMYILDFAGGGAVHLVAGVAGLVLCLFAKLHNYLDERQIRKKRRMERLADNAVEDPIVREESESIANHNFWEWMYPVDGGGESTNEAALGVLILWFCWFAFNCGSTESVEAFAEPSHYGGSFHNVPSVIAVNMILAAAAGGTLSVVVATWAQIRSQSDSINANEIANGIVSAIVAITAGCPFVDYWAACVIGVIAVVVYHCGCYLEYKFGIEDTARIVPVHGLCGVWSLLATGIFIFDEATCNVHSTIEGLCYRQIRLPQLSHLERIGTQIIAILLMTGITASFSFALYGLLYIIPIRSQLQSNSKFASGFNKFMSRVFKIVFNRNTVHFEGNLLFTGPEEVSHNDINERHIRRVNLNRPAPQTPNDQTPDDHHTSSARLLAQSAGSNNNGSRSYGATKNETRDTTESELRGIHSGRTPVVPKSKYSESSFDGKKFETC